MSDPFSAKTDALYASDLGSDAAWKVGGAGSGTACRVRLARPDELIPFGHSRAVMPAIMIRVRVSEIAGPAADDVVTVGTASYRVSAEPRYHGTRRLEWLCEAVEL